MRIKLLYKKPSVVALILIPVFLFGCGTDTTSSPETDNDIQPTEITSAPLEEIADIGAATATDLPVGELADPADPSVETAPELGFALGDPNLRATDPSTVSLASGQIQLIEFFAFW